jgi:hypothetical protein
MHRLSFLLLLLPIDALGQCTVMGTPELRDPVTAPTHVERSDGPAQFVVPTLFHVYYTDVVPPVDIVFLDEVLRATNAVLRGRNPDTSLVTPLFRPLMGDLSVELHLAHIDVFGNCTNGVVYHWWNGLSGPNVLQAAQATDRYLNIHLYGNSSYAMLPSADWPLPGDLWDGATVAPFQLMTDGHVLAHEVAHWCGLPHTFGSYPSSGMFCGDDGVTDTPVTKGSLPLTCDPLLSECTPGTIENVNNIMDYSSCRHMFTHGQAQLVELTMTDTAIARYMHCTPENLAGTGVDVPSPCPLEVSVRPVSVSGCSPHVTVTMMATGKIPDQLSWSFPGGTPSTWTGWGPMITYTTPGDHDAQVVACAGADCDTLTFSVHAEEPLTLLDNGLTPILDLPFGEDLETTSIPNAHVAPTAESDWELCIHAGYNSQRSLMVTAGTVQQQETHDLIIGNLDLVNDLEHPVLRMMVAATEHATVQRYSSQLLGRDLCSDGQSFFYVYATWDHGQLAGGNTGTGFIPDDPQEWTALTADLNVDWIDHSNAELILRLIKEYHGTATDEGFYVDDIWIGEADAVPTSVDAIDVEEHGLSLYPVPASDRITLANRGNRPIGIRILDALGREVHRGTLLGTRDLDVSRWPRGSYVVRCTEGRLLTRSRFILH